MAISRFSLLAVAAAAPQCDYSLIEISEECPSDYGFDWTLYHEQLYHARSLVFAGDARGSQQAVLSMLEAVTRRFWFAFECPLAVAATYFSLAQSFAFQGRMRRALAFVHMGFIFVRDKGFSECTPWPVQGWDMLLAGRNLMEVVRRLEDESITPTAPQFRLRERVAIVSICAYGEEEPVRVIGTENHEIYAQLHGYDLFQITSSAQIAPNLASGMDINDGVHKPFFWKVNAVKNVLEQQSPRYDWVLWIDCDAFFMDPGRTIDSVIHMHAANTTAASRLGPRQWQETLEVAQLRQRLHPTMQPEAAHGSHDAPLNPFKSRAEAMNVGLDRPTRQAQAMTSAQARTWLDELTVFEATRLVANCTDWQVVLGALQRLRLHSVVVDVVCLTAACKALLQALQWQRTLSLFHGAAALALAANERTYGVALAACAGSHGGWKDAVHLFGCMPTVRLEQNSFLQSAAVTALDAALHGWSAALSLMVQVTSRGTPSNIVASNAVFSTCAQHWPVTLSLLRWVQGRSLQADAFTSNSVLAALGASGQWHRSLSAVGGMSRKSIPFQQVTFNSAIASCGAGHWGTALWLLGSSIKASVVTYSACISACEKSYQWQLPSSLLFSLCQKGLVPNAVAEGTVLQALTWAAQWRRTFAALQAATPSAPAFNAALRSLGAAWERGLAQLEQMILHRQEPDVCSTNQLLGRKLGVEPAK
eukprot:s2112_g9.t3